METSPLLARGLLLPVAITACATLACKLLDKDKDESPTVPPTKAVSTSISPSTSPIAASGGSTMSSHVPGLRIPSGGVMDSKLKLGKMRLYKYASGQRESLARQAKASWRSQGWTISGEKKVGKTGSMTMELKKGSQQVGVIIGSPNASGTPANISLIPRS